MVPSKREEPGTNAPSRLSVMLAWLLVSAPLLWGVWQTIKKAAILFR